MTGGKAARYRQYSDEWYRAQFAKYYLFDPELETARIATLWAQGMVLEVFGGRWRIAVHKASSAVPWRLPAGCIGVFICTRQGSTSYEGTIAQG